MPQQWKVVGGAEKGGIIVRVSSGLASTQLPERLATGAIVEEREVLNDRLRFRKLEGTGPITGWVSIRAGGNDLVIHHTPTRFPPVPHGFNGTRVAVPSINAPATGGNVGSSDDREHGFEDYARRILASRPATLAQWYKDEEMPVICGTTTIKWTKDGHVWHEMAETWDSQPHAENVQHFDLTEMDNISGVEIETLGSDQVSRAGRQTRLATVNAARTDCVKCTGCIRPPGHVGPCIDCMGEELRPKPKPPRPGVYCGISKDVTCPGDDVTYEIILGRCGRCTFECTPKMSLFAGGQPPWYCSGRWEFDGRVIDACITKEDFRGPKEDAEIEIPVDITGKTVFFKNTECKWQRPPPLPVDLNLTGLWILTPVHDSNGETVHVRLEHETGKKTFTGNQKGFESIDDGHIEGDVIEWDISTYHVRGRIEDDGDHLVDLEIKDERVGFSAMYVAERKNVEQTVCAVCLEQFDDFDTEQSLRELPCEHKFHTVCVSAWINVRHNCPVCRAQVHH